MSCTPVGQAFLLYACVLMCTYSYLHPASAAHAYTQRICCDTGTWRMLTWAMLPPAGTGWCICTKCADPLFLPPGSDPFMPVRIHVRVVWVEGCVDSNQKKKLIFVESDVRARKVCATESFGWVLVTSSCSWHGFLMPWFGNDTLSQHHAAQVLSPMQQFFSWKQGNIIKGQNFWKRGKEPNLIP